MSDMVSAQELLHDLTQEAADRQEFARQHGYLEFGEWRIWRATTC